LTAQAITVHLHNVSAASERDITELKQTASAIFERSGIRLSWIDCTVESESCAAHQSITNITLLVVNEHFHPGDHAIGWTTLGSYAITLNYRRAQKMSRASTLDLSCGRILGHTAAHEIGHLLLGSPNHRLFGLMKATYNSRDLLAMAQGRLFFTELDAHEMTRRLWCHQIG
jgi:hypothetical protein